MQADKEQQVEEAAWAVMHSISKLAYNVDADQITRAKNQLKAQILFSQDGPSGKDTDSDLYWPLLDRLNLFRQGLHVPGLLESSL